VTTAPLGLSVMPLENRRETLLHAAVAGERAGYDGFYLPETWAHDVTVMLAEIAGKTSRIGLGTGVLGVWSRSAGTLAMAASTLHGVSGGRFALGLGASTPQLTEGLHDVPYRAPLERMRRVLTQVRALLRGERVALAETSARPLKLNLPPAPVVPLYLAGLNPATVRLAGELADGWLPFLYPRSRLGQGRALLEEGRARGGGARPATRIVPSIPAVVARDGAEARKGAAWFVSFYLTSMGPLYPKTLAELGFEKEVQAVLAANTTRGSAVVPADADALLEELTVFGTPDEARARLARWRDAGAELPVLLLPPDQSPEQIDFALAAFR
jgi:alkanesulfonate monooxygenase SsuD/methylene tetrahydromethanopterin reductase-like flavin-dependent oxidoreductase (luciferase family)